MTPLAQRVVNELLLPPRKRTFIDQCGLLGVMDDVHCFEVSDVVGLASEMGAGMAESSEKGEFIDEDLAFLPAEKTWIEWRVEGDRMAVLLVCPPYSSTAQCYWALDLEGVFHSARSVGRLSLRGADLSSRAALPAAMALDQSREAGAGAFPIYASLALINTPRVIGRRQHMPHAGLERRLLAARRTVGKFPLHAWTEIKLEVGRPPENASDDPSIEAHLTGARALHFCRAHLRIKGGRVEFVRSHWRGDSSLGIKRSRYKVAA